MSDTSPLSPALATPGMVLANKYRLDRKLGQGGMGVVYLARHLETGKPVAVKLLDLSGINRSEALERFHREALASARIKHPGVIEIQDVGTEQGMPFLVMEYLSGFTLHELAREGALSPGIVSAVMAPVLDALGAAHRAGILHRDLKPANVMLVEAPKHMVKLLDFGVARYAAALKPVTQTGAAIGTPAYMSPEQVVGKKELTAATDLYSVGVTLFELLTGRRVFEIDSLMGLMTAVVKDPPPPIATVKPDLPPALCELVDALLVKDPQRRPNDAEVVREELLKAVPPDEKALWALAFPALPENREGSTQVRAYVPEQPRRLWPWVALGSALALALGVGALMAREQRNQVLDTLVANIERPVEPPPSYVPPPPDPVQAPPLAEPPRPCSLELLESVRPLIRRGALGDASAELATCRDSPGKFTRALGLVEAELREERHCDMILDQAERDQRAHKTQQIASLTSACRATRGFQERFDRVMAEAKKAGARLPDPRALRNEALSAARETEQYLRQNEFENAEVSASACRSSDPTLPTCYRLSGDVLDKLKRTDEAAQNYQRFIDLAPKDPEAKRVRRFLENYLAQSP